MKANAENSISSYEIYHALGITQKTAWFMQQRIRLATQNGDFFKQLAGEVEVDEPIICSDTWMPNALSSTPQRRCWDQVLKRGTVCRQEATGVGDFDWRESGGTGAFCMKRQRRGKNNRSE